MKSYESQTLGLIKKHWIGTLPDQEQGPVTFPFDLQNFCIEVDTLLALIKKPGETRKLHAVSQHLHLGPLGKHLYWAVYQGEEGENRQKAPIAFFILDSDANRFIFGEPICSCEREMTGQQRLSSNIIVGPGLIK